MQQVPDRTALSGQVYNVLTEGIALNTKAQVSKNPETNRVEYQGNKTECALLLMCQDLDFDYIACRRSFNNRNALPQLYSFSSSRKRMSIFAELENGTFRLYTKVLSVVFFFFLSSHFFCPSLVDDVGCIRSYP